MATQATDRSGVYGHAPRRGPPYRASFGILWLAAALALTACGSGSSQGGNPAARATEVRTLATATLHLNGDPATPRGLARIVPDTDPLVKLGQVLFFSQTLGAGYDVSCGTCHHPDFAGGDGLSLSVGVSPANPAAVGPGRVIDPYRDLDPSGDGGPNMHRNSLTTFNAGLFDRALMFDGRVFVLDHESVPGGHGQRVRTPESGQNHDIQPLDGMMELTMKGPIVNDNEMRAFLYTDLATPADYREHLVQRLRGTVDTRYNPKHNAADRWLKLFRAAFSRPAGTAAELITMPNMQRALAAYINSQIFVDTPWRAFLEGDDAAISASAREGARLFLASRDQGGLACNACHHGDRFTDEDYHNVAFPQLGRGFNFSEHYDMGRWLATRAAGDEQAFRTPSLLNVARTAPYGHTGAFATLQELLVYHADPRRGVDRYDFALSGLEQFKDGKVSYPQAEQYTREAIARPGFAEAEALLPRRKLTRREVRDLVAFLETLTDRCVATPACIGQWTPREEDDPDGHLLVRNRPLGTPEYVDAQRPSDYVPSVPMHFPPLARRATFADVQGCDHHVGMGGNDGRSRFEQRSGKSFGLVDRHGYQADTWFNPQQSTLEVAMNGGGVSAAYLDDDCWPDLVYTGGAVSGMRFYLNKSGLRFSSARLLTGTVEPEHSGAAIADLNGDYRRELVLGNIKPGDVPVFSADGRGRYQQVAGLPMARPTFGISFAPLGERGNLYMYLGHWSGGTGTNGTSPALWRSDGENLYVWDGIARTTSAFVNQKFNFTPKFADFTGDGRMDLALTSDFLSSTSLRNVKDAGGGWHLERDTDHTVLTDENGMGSALLDLDNDGNLEWFVTSVSDTTGSVPANWGVTGNRLYRNASTTEKISFTDITDAAGVRHGYWGWGACAQDFNNDGFIDLFHVNGFGRIPDEVATSPEQLEQQKTYTEITAVQFQGKPPRLFINNGNGSFSEQAEQWGIAVPSEGRGVACFDYNRDGDVDIVIFDHSRTPQFFENRIGADAGRRFLNVRLVGAAPNTDAIGARVYVTADVGRGHGVQTQLRLAEANSNFNSQNLPDLYFGLGEAAVVDSVRIVWLGGAELTCRNLQVNQFLVIDQRAPPAGCSAASALPRPVTAAR